MKIIKNGWDFFQDQILGMHWLKDLIGKLLVKARIGRGKVSRRISSLFPV